MTVRRPDRRRDRAAERNEARSRRASREPAGVLGDHLKARGASLLLTTLAIVGAIHGSILLGIEVKRVLHLRGEVTRLERDIGALEREAGALRDVAAHADDALYREQLARRQGFVFPDEVRVLPLGSRSTAP